MPYYERLARHFEAAKQYNEAKEYFIRAKLAKEAVEMYIRANNWEGAQKVYSVLVAETMAEGRDGCFQLHVFSQISTALPRLCCGNRWLHDI